MRSRCDLPNGDAGRSSCRQYVTADQLRDKRALSPSARPRQKPTEHYPEGLTGEGLERCAVTFRLPAGRCGRSLRRCVPSQVRNASSTATLFNGVAPTSGHLRESFVAQVGDPGTGAAEMTGNQLTLRELPLIRPTRTCHHKGTWGRRQDLCPPNLRTKSGDFSRVHVFCYRSSSPAFECSP
jgi:hypothetical protein